MTIHFCPNCWTETRARDEVCASCGYELERFEQLPYEEKLITALRHPVMENRMVAIQLLGQLRSEAAVPEFERILSQDDDFYTLRAVLHALDLIGTPRSRALIDGVADHGSGLIRKLAVELAASPASGADDAHGEGSDLHNGKRAE